MSGVGGAGLCNLCAHQRVVRTGRGSAFSMCELAKADERFAKYPRIPVVRCSGFSGGEAGSPDPSPAEPGPSRA